MPRIKVPNEKRSDASAAFFFLCLYTVSVLVRPHEFSVATENLIFIRIFAIVTLLLTLMLLRPLRISPQLAMLMLMLPQIMLSAFFNGWGSGGIQQAERLLVSSIIPLFLFSSLLNSVTRQRIILAITLFAAMIMVYNGYLQQSNFNGRFGMGIGGSTSVGREEMRITYLGFFGDPNDLGMLLVMCIPMAFYFMSSRSSFIKLLMIMVVLALGYGIYMTGSRGTLLGAMGLAGLFVLISKGGAKTILFSVMAAPIVATLIAQFGGLSSAESSANGRLEAWYAGVQMLLYNPVFGVGMGNFIEEHERVAHNSFIHVAAELGTIGYCLWGGALILSLFSGYSILKTVTADEDETELKSELLLHKTIFYSMIGFVLTAFFLSRQFTLLMFIFLGLLTASQYLIMKRKPELLSLYSGKNIMKSIGFSWFIILAVYAALKVGL